MKYSIQLITTSRVENVKYSLYHILSISHILCKLLTLFYILQFILHLIDFNLNKNLYLSNFKMDCTLIIHLMY